MRNLYAIYVPMQLGCWLPAEDIPRIVKEAIPKLCLDAVLPFIYQLAARLDMKDRFIHPDDPLMGINLNRSDCVLECQETPFQQTLDDLLLRLAQKGSPALWPLISLRNGADVPKFLRCLV